VNANRAHYVALRERERERERDLRGYSGRIDHGYLFLGNIGLGEMRADAFKRHVYTSSADDLGTRRIAGAIYS